MCFWNQTHRLFLKKAHLLLDDVRVSCLLLQTLNLLLLLLGLRLVRNLLLRQPAAATGGGEQKTVHS